MKNKKLRMKALFMTVAVAAAGLVMTSCSKDDLLNVTVPMEYSEITFKIPPTLLSGAYADSVEVATNIDSLLNTKGISQKNIKSIKIKSLEFYVLNGDDNNNFRIIQNLDGMLSKDGQEAISVGDVKDNPDISADTLRVNVDKETDYKSYMSGKTFKFKVVGNTRGIVTREMNVKAKAKFAIAASM